MKILLVKPIVQFDGSVPSTICLKSVGIGYIASVLRQRGHDAKILTCSRMDFEYYYKKHTPDIVGFSNIFWDFWPILEMAKSVRRINPKTKIVLGGQFPTFVYDKILTKHPHLFDFIVVGEGEITMLELVESLVKANPDFKKIKGLAFMEKGAPIFTGERELIQDLDSLPFPTRDRSKYTTVVSSRGCSMNCRFCVGKNFNRRIRRQRSIGNLEKELTLLKKKGSKYIFFADDELFEDKQRFYSLESMLKKPNIKGMIYRGQFHPKLIIQEPSILLRLEKLGFRQVGIGIQSANSEDLNYFRSTLSFEEVQKVLDIISNTRLKRMKVWVYYIINTARETNITEIRKKTEEFYKRIKAMKSKSVEVHPFMLDTFIGSDAFYDNNISRDFLLDKKKTIAYVVTNRVEPHAFNYASSKVPINQLIEVYQEYKRKFIEPKRYSLLWIKMLRFAQVWRSSLRPATKAWYLLNSLAIRLKKIFSPGLNSKAAQQKLFARIFE